MLLVPLHAMALLTSPKRKGFGRKKATWAESCFPGWDLGGALSCTHKNPLEMQREERLVLPAATLSLESQAGVAFKVPFLCPDGKNKLVAGAVRGLGSVKSGEGMWGCLPHAAASVLGRGGLGSSMTRCLFQLLVCGC